MIIGFIRLRGCRFRRDRRGNITIMGAVLLPVLIGMAALVAEFGHGLLVRVENQRVADIAAFAGAIAYGPASSTAAMNAAVSNVATLNGLPSTALVPSIVTSPSGSGNQAVSVQVSTSSLLLLAPVLGTGHSLPISASAQAEIAASASACIIALSASGTGVTMSGGTALSAPNCAIASNNTVSAPCGTTITTKNVNYNSTSAPSNPCGGIRPPTGTASVTYKKVATTDPLVANSGVVAATARIATVNTMTAPAAPTVTPPTGGTAIDFAWDQTATQNAAVANGCTATWASGTSTWTLACPASTDRKFGRITIGGGIKVMFNTTGPATNVYKFSGSIENTNGSTMTFGPGTFNVAGNILVDGPTTFGAGNFNVTGTIQIKQGTIPFGAGTYNVAQGIMTEGASIATFGAGTFNVGPLPASLTCNAAERYSVCHKSSGTLTFGGPSTFKLSAGLYVGGGATLVMGSGTTNSYQFGPSLGTGGGSAISLGGGAKVKLADASGGSSLFQSVGHINFPAGGGSCLTLPVAAQHDIKGNIVGAGGTILGAGVYTVAGYVAFGASGGGSVTCDGATVGVSGTGVTLVISGTATYPSGTCAGKAFCLGAGYGNVTLTAPTSGTTAKLIVVGPTSSSITAGALFAEGASTSLSGAFYFPKGPINLDGGASLGNGSGQCLEVIGTQVTMNGGTVLGTTCFSQSGSTRTVLVQ